MSAAEKRRRAMATAREFCGTPENPPQENPPLCTESSGADVNKSVRPKLGNRPRSQDPFKRNWDWLYGKEEPEADDTIPKNIGVPRRDRKELRRVISYSLASAALAASIFFAIGFFASRNNGPRGEIALASLTAQLEPGGRGPENLMARLDISEAPMTGFLTVIVPLPGEASMPYVFPVSPSQDIRVIAGQSASTGHFPEDVSEPKVAVAIITPTPVADSLEKYLATKRIVTTESDIPALESAIRDALKDLNFQEFCLGSIEFPKKADQQ